MIVLDTNVLSELMRAEPAPAVLTWLSAQDPAGLVTTAVTVAEIRYGIARLPVGQRARALAEAADEVFGSFPDGVLAFDLAAAVAYGDIVAGRERAGLPIDALDAQIAAICRSTGALLATRNLPDFASTGVELVDPFVA